MNREKELLIGAHTSGAGGLHNALLEGRKIGATTIQLFTSNQRQWKGKALAKEQIAHWKEVLAETGLQKIMSHDSYLINLGSPKPEVLQKSRHAFREEVVRCLQLGISYLNFHPGAALDGGVEPCLNRIVESLLAVEELVADSPLRLLLETTAGQGSVVGCRFEQLAYIIERVEKRVPVGVCLDTCHSFVAGYDLRTWEAWEETLDLFDQQIGITKLFAFHLNDSLKGIGSRVDRHQPLGKGKIGLDCFRYLMQSPRTRHLPKYLETPGGPHLWGDEIALLRKFAQES